MQLPCGHIYTDLALKFRKLSFWVRHVSTAKYSRNNDFHGCLLLLCLTPHPPVGSWGGEDIPWRRQGVWEILPKHSPCIPGGLCQNIQGTPQKYGDQLLCCIKGRVSQCLTLVKSCMTCTSNNYCHAWANLHPPLLQLQWNLGIGTPKGLWKTVLNSEVVLFLRGISVYWIDLGTEVTVLNSQVVPISQVVAKTGFTVLSLSGLLECEWVPLLHWLWNTYSMYLVLSLHLENQWLILYLVTLLFCSFILVLLFDYSDKLTSFVNQCLCHV